MSNYLDEARFITSVFQKRRMLVRVDRVLLTPDSVIYFLKRAPTFQVSELRRVLDDLESLVAEHRLGNGTWGGRVSIRLDLQPLYLEVPRSDPVPLRWHLLGGVPADHFVVGRSFTPFPEDVRFTLTETPHVLVAGATGSGKTNLLRTMIMSLARSTDPRDVDVYIVDLKDDGDFEYMKRLAHVSAVIGDMDEAITLIRRIYAHLQSNDERKQRVLLIIDEFADFILAGGRAGKEASSMLSSMAQKGRTRKVNLWLATQKPSAKTMDTFTRANITTRLVGMVTDADEARIAFGYKQSGAERLPGTGAFLVRSNGISRRLTVYYANDDVVVEEVKAINDRWKILLGEDLDEELPPAIVANDIAEDKTHVPLVPPELVPVFDEYAGPDLSLRRGGMTAAMIALYGDKRPRGGPPFYKARDRIISYLHTYEHTHNKHFLAPQRAAVSK